MSAFAPITLADSVPANVVYSPQSIDSNGVAKWLNHVGVLDAQSSITHSVTLPKNGSPVVRVKLKLSDPIMDAVDTSKRVDTAYANVEFVLPKNCSAVVRANLKAKLISLLSKAEVTAAINDFESIY